MKKVSPLKQIPTISRHRCFAETRRLIDNPIDVLQHHTQRSGESFRYYFGGAQKVLVSSNAAVIQHVLKDNHSNYHKSHIQTRHMVNYLGKGLLSDEWDEWRPKRKQMQQGFKTSQLDTQASLMQDALQELQPKFNQKISTGELDIAPQLCEFVFTMTARALFGISMSTAEIKQISETVSKVQTFMVRQVFQPYLSPWFHLSGQVSHHQRLRSRGDALLLEHIKARLRGYSVKTQSSNLLDVLFDMMSHNNPAPLTIDKLLAEAMQFLVAGHETSSNTLSWVITLLDLHPQYQSVMLKEFELVLGSRAASYSDLRYLPQTLAILDESMRLYPPFWMLDRIALNDDDIHGIKVKCGDSVMCFLYGLHRSSDQWNELGADLDQFRPERFIKSLKTPVKNLYYLPFGTGPRRCIAEQLARLQMVLILQMVYQNYKIKLSNPLIELEPRFTLSRKHGLTAIITKR